MYALWTITHSGPYDYNSVAIALTMRLCFFTTLAVASSYAFVVVPSAHAQPLAARRVAPLPRTGHVVAISTYTQWDVLFNREKVRQVCVLPTLVHECGMARATRSPALPHPAPERPHHSRRHPPNAPPQ